VEHCCSRYCCIERALNISKTWGHIHCCLTNRGPQSYKIGQFIETSLQLTKSSFNLLLQT
jgi:hypothetical protein